MPSPAEVTLDLTPSSRIDVIEAVVFATHWGAVPLAWRVATPDG